MSFFQDSGKLLRMMEQIQQQLDMQSTQSKWLKEELEMARMDARETAEKQAKLLEQSEEPLYLMEKMHISKTQISFG